VEGGASGSSGSGGRGGGPGKPGRGSGPGDRHGSGGREGAPPEKVTFVRLEKPTYLDDIAHVRVQDQRHALPNTFLIESGASQKRKLELNRAEKLRAADKPGVAGALSTAKGYADSLGVIQKKQPTAKEAEKIRRLRAKHATSSATSPFISATPAFTSGGEGQLHYLKAHLAEGRKSFVTVHESRRRITHNETNSREQELLVPFGEHRAELRGFLQVTPVMGVAEDGARKVSSVRALFVDMSVSPPRVLTGRKAIHAFQSMTPHSKDEVSPAAAAAAPHASAAAPVRSRLAPPRATPASAARGPEKSEPTRSTRPGASSFAAVGGPRSASASKPFASFKPRGGGGPKGDVRETSSAAEKPLPGASTRSASTSRSLPPLTMPGAPEPSASPVGGSLLSKPSTGYASRNFSSASSPSPSKASGGPKAAAPRPKPPEAHPPAKPDGSGGK
jgi:hypothetical protein